MATARTNAGAPGNGGEMYLEPGTQRGGPGGAQTTQYLEPKNQQPGHMHDNELGNQTTLTNGMLQGGSPIGRQISVTLTPEQFEQLYLQPGGVGGKGDLSKRFGNPTPLGIAGFLLSLTPLSIYLMNFGQTTATSATAIIGAFYALGGVCMILAGLLEWVLGNTFPFFVFTTFGGYWIAFAILNDPMIGVAAAFSANGNATEGSANPLFAEGVAVYLVVWGVLVFIYMIGSLRTNVVFVILFFTLDVAFFLLAAGYFRIGEGRDPTSLLRAGGAFAFVTTLCGWWIMLALVLGSTGFPFSVPLGDLSGFLSKKKTV